MTFEEKLANCTFKFPPSDLQRRVLKEVHAGERNLLIGAVAGSGKTATLEMIAQMLKGQSAMFCAFNRHIADELAEKLPNIQVNTIHSFGLEVLRQHITRPKIKGFKPTMIVEELMKRKYAHEITDYYGQYHKPRYTEKGMLIKNMLLDMSDLVRQNAITDALALTLHAPQIAAHHGVGDYDESYNEDIWDMIQESTRMAESSGIIDFTDMIYLPVALNLSFNTRKWILVDECQDLNKLQLEVVLRFGDNKDSRFIFVGDKAQAIYGFAGADSSSFENVGERTDALKLPLSVCYRCPSRHIELAKEIVPQITPSEWAIEGRIEKLGYSQVFSVAKPGDLILCRVNAPLVSTAISFLKNRIPAEIKGRDISRNLIKTLEDATKMADWSWSAPLAMMDRYMVRELEKMERKRSSEMAKIAFSDKIDCIKTIIVEFNCKTPEEFRACVGDIFEDGKGNRRDPVMLSSVHKAKGLEADNVFILRPDMMPLVWDEQQHWEFEQEMNIKYVALTRAKKFLGFLEPVLEDQEF